MKLEKEEIKFIDNYLMKSGVEYLDIRYEMIDHIASAIEEKMVTENANFYEAFKEYMVYNKKVFLKTNKKYSRSAWRKAFELLKKNVISINFLFLNISILCLFYGVKAVLPQIEISFYFNGLHVALITAFFAVTMYRVYSGDDRFSIADKMLWIYYGLYFFINKLLKIEDKINSVDFLLVYYSVIIALVIVTIYTYYQLIKNYQKKFKSA